MIPPPSTTTTAPPCALLHAAARWQLLPLFTYIRVVCIGEKIMLRGGLLNAPKRERERKKKFIFSPQPSAVPTPAVTGGKTNDVSAKLRLPRGVALLPLDAA